MELESDMVSVTMGCHQREDRLTRHMGSDCFLLAFSGTDESLETSHCFGYRLGKNSQKYPTISSNRLQKNHVIFLYHF